MKYGHGQVLDSLVKDGLWDVYNDIHMVSGIARARGSALVRVLSGSTVGGQHCAV